MSKRFKIILSLVIIVLLLGVAVYNYLLSTGRIKFKAAQQVTTSTVKDTYTYDEVAKYAKSDKPAYGWMPEMWVTNVTKGRGIDSDGSLIAYPGDTLEIGASITTTIGWEPDKGNCCLSGASLFNVPSDANHNGFEKYTTIVQNSWIARQNPEGACTMYPQGNGGDAGDQKVYYGPNEYPPNNLGKDAVIWRCLTPSDVLCVNCVTTVSFRAKIKDQGELAKLGLPHTIKTGWAIGWADGCRQGNLQTYWWSGDPAGPYKHIAIKIKSPPSPPPPCEGKPNPAITKIEPSTWVEQSGNKTITLSGSNFKIAGQPGDPKVKVWLTTSSEPSTYINTTSTSDTKITFNYPADKVGSYYVKVVNNCQKGSNKVTFSITSSPPPPQAKITGQKSPSKDLARPGETVTYTLTTKNEGNGDAKDFVIEDDITDVLKYAEVISVSDNGKLEGTKIKYPARDIGAGQQVLTSFDVKIKTPDKWPKNGDYQMTNTYQPSQYSPASTVTVKVGYSSIAAVSKYAFNETQNIDATEKNANPGDVIRYTLEAENKGNLEEKGYKIEEDISDILSYADVTELGGGQITGNKITWLVNIPAGSRTAVIFKVKIKPASAWPTAGDLTMKNTYGNTIDVKLEPQSVAGAVVAPVTATLTRTGTAIVLIIVIALLLVIVYWIVKEIVARKRQK